LSLSPAPRQPSRRLWMPVRITVGEDEPIARAIRRFNEAAQVHHRRPWSKPRPGFYEKPGTVRRRKRVVKEMNARAAGLPAAPGGGGLRFYWRWQALWRRSLPLRGFAH